jgi:integrase
VKTPLDTRRLQPELQPACGVDTARLGLPSGRGLVRDGSGRVILAEFTTRKEGIHQLRHYFASVMLAGGVSVKELAEYLGHADPGFTLRVYAHLLPSSHDRARIVIDDHFRSFGQNSHGTAASHHS